jgi:hypothetical protein
MGNISNTTSINSCYTSVYVQSILHRKRVRLVTINGQVIQPGLFVSCSRKERNKIPVGSIIRLDCRKIVSDNRKPYLRLSGKQPITQLSFFDHKFQSTQLSIFI